LDREACIEQRDVHWTERRALDRETCIEQRDVHWTERRALNRETCIGQRDLHWTERRALDRETQQSQFGDPPRTQPICQAFPRHFALPCQLFSTWRASNQQSRLQALSTSGAISLPLHDSSPPHTAPLHHTALSSAHSATQQSAANHLSVLQNGMSL
jgi:hypothetical protein